MNSEQSMAWEIVLPGDSAIPPTEEWCVMTVFGRVAVLSGALHVWNAHDKTYAMYGPGRWCVARCNDADDAHFDVGGLA